MVDKSIAPLRVIAKSMTNYEIKRAEQEFLGKYAIPALPDKSILVMITDSGTYVPQEFTPENNRAKDIFGEISNLLRPEYQLQRVFLPHDVFEKRVESALEKISNDYQVYCKSVNSNGVAVIGVPCGAFDLIKQEFDQERFMVISNHHPSGLIGLERQYIQYRAREDGVAEHAQSERDGVSLH